MTTPPITRRWWAMAAITLAVLAVGLDGTILSVALPTLAGALHATESELQWFSSGYALVLAAGMLPAGLLADRYGRKALMVGSLVLFGLGSVGCALSPTPEAFIAARFVLGIAGAGLIVTALSLMAVLFSETERPRAVGIWAAANFLALPIGPILGGWLLTNFWWGWVFLLNVPVAIVGLVAVLVLVPESRAPEQPGIDLLGIVLSSGGLAILTYGFIEAGVNGWSSVTTIVPIIVGIGVLVGFIAWQAWLGGRPNGQPLTDLRLFRSRAFTWGVLLTAVAIMSMIGLLFGLPQFFQAVLGTDAMGAGLRLLPLIGGLILGAVPADRLAVRIGSKLTVALGFAVLATGLGIGATTTPSSSDAFLGLWVMICGIGMGLALATSASSALVALPADRAGVGAALLQAVQKLGAPFGAAILGSVVNGTYQSHLQLAGQPAAVVETMRSSVFAGLAAARQLGSPEIVASIRAAFTAGVDDAFRVAAGIAVVGIVLALAFLPGVTSARGRAPELDSTRPAAGEPQGAELAHDLPVHG
jgi:DHA2 family multidrug resistance protein-like MFS transporter